MLFFKLNINCYHDLCFVNFFQYCMVFSLHVESVLMCFIKFFVAEGASFRNEGVHNLGMLNELGPPMNWSMKMMMMRTVVHVDEVCTTKKLGNIW